MDFCHHGLVSVSVSNVARRVTRLFTLAGMAGAAFVNDSCRRAFYLPGTRLKRLKSCSGLNGNATEAG